MAIAKSGTAGKTLRGKIPFAAATSGTLEFRKGGFNKDDYSVAVEPLRRRTYVIDIGAAANATSYGLVIAGQARAYLSDADATAPEVLAGVRALFSAFPQFSVGTSTDGDTFPVTVLDEDGDATLVAGANTTVTPGIETAPNYRVIKENGQVRIETAAAFTGAFDVTVTA